MAGKSQVPPVVAIAAAPDPIPVVLQWAPQCLLVPEAAVQNGQAASHPKLALLDGNLPC